MCDGEWVVYGGKLLYCTGGVYFDEDGDIVDEGDLDDEDDD